jgi:hypothetical protein
LVTADVSRYKKFELWCQLIMSAGTKNHFFKKNPKPRSRPNGARSKLAVIGPRHRCLGGALAVGDDELVNIDELL